MQNSINLNDYYILEETDINKFWVNGFIHLKNVLSKKEINFYRKEISKTAKKDLKTKKKNLEVLFTKL